MKPQSDQQGLETENQVVNIIRHLNERWEQRLTLDNLRLAERYVKGELHLLIHFRVGGVTEEYAALLKRKLPISGPQEDVERRELFSDVGRPQFMNVRPDVEAMVSGAYGQEGTVLVDVVQLVDAPERIVPHLCMA